MTELLNQADRLECLTCGHEWSPEAEPEAPEAERVVKDAYGAVLADGDIVAMIKDQAQRYLAGAQGRDQIKTNPVS
jgi:protein PhnA